jgi:hypothetical protein
MAADRPGSEDAAARHHAEGLAAGAECLAAALDYLARGWPALGLCPPDHVGVGKEHAAGCDHPGKRPLPDFGRWKEWQDALPPAERVRGWWRNHPQMNVGVALGPLSGLVGIDPDGPAGEAKLAELSGGELPPTLEFRTHAGRRLLYRIPAGANFRPTFHAVEAGQELRFLAYGSETVMPPSRHPAGGRYEWVAGRGPGEIEAAPAPAWLVAHLTAPAGRPRAESLADGETIPRGRRDVTLTSLAGTMRARGFSREAMEAALLVENGRCDPPLDESQVEKIARSVARYEPDAFSGVWLRPSLPGMAPQPLSPGNVFGLGVTSMDALSPQPLEWLVPGYLPKGKLVLLAGDGGHGKSVLTLHLAARLSRGLMPFGMLGPCPPGSTLLVSCEDDWEDTILPRLMSAGADLARVFRVDGVRDKDGKLSPFSLAHFEALEAELAGRPDVKLVVIDPAGAFVGRTGIDDHRDSELRALLGPLTELAARRGVTILLVKHLNKGVTAKAVHKVGGSGGYVNAVRAAFIVAPDPDDKQRKFFMPLKFNLGPPPASLAYRLEGLAESERETILAGCVHLHDEDRKRLGEQLFRPTWLGVAEADADTVMAAPSRVNSSSERADRKRDEAADWLLEFLAPGPQGSAEVFAAGKAKGFSRDTLFRARTAMPGRVRAEKDGRGGWRWDLVAETPPQEEGDIRTPWDDDN